MTDKVQKIREEVERLKSNLIYGACASQVVMETYCKEEAYNEVLAILDTMQEEHNFKVGDKLRHKTLKVEGSITNISENGSIDVNCGVYEEFDIKVNEWELVEECNITGIKSKHATGKLKECIDNQTEEGLEQARKQLQEEPVSIWHDSNEEQPNFASTVVIWSPKYKNGELISRCTKVYSDRIWAYIDDLLKI